jgi:hypothetical protein
MSFGLLGLLALAFFIFAVFFVFKQIQFFFTAVDLYKGMNQRLDKVIELLSANRTLTQSLGATNHRGTETGTVASPSSVLATLAAPAGKCPNCAAVIPLESETCPKCKASFGAGSAWTVLPR